MRSSLTCWASSADKVRGMDPETNPDRSYYDPAAHYDVESVRFFDVAHEGAHVRAVAQAAELLDGLRNTSPRSVVVLVTDAVSEAAAQSWSTQTSTRRTPS